ncbi:peptidoglycan DD-metalloendopeptidase family protein [Angustibacter luteus]|uniref:Peptidoglycan DD-metalloendopeptidase family protein n=1 Tax=Angustibacter luteus TaxID=658456 RepID=A0ABW1JBS6_9ACTN
MSSALRHALRVGLRPGLLLLALVGVLAGLQSATTTATATATASSSAATSAAAPSALHPYSDPTVFPLRKPASVSCVLSNCPGPYHGHWAIDFGGTKGDPVHAAGAGVFHVGAIDRSCPDAGVTAGTWAWVDHGAAGVTRYNHLDSIVAKDGALVTPDTVIGTMGNWGNTKPCRVSYLHLEFRAERLSGPFRPIPSMNACLSGVPVAFPSEFGYSSWNSIPVDQVHTPAVTSDCLAPAATPNRPTLSAQRGSRSVLVVPSARPAGVGLVRIKAEMYHPSLHAYTLLKYRDLPPTQRATTFGGLLDGRTYRFSAAYHNASGWSAWSTTHSAIPASVPTTPRYRGLSASSTTVSHLWYRSTSLGTSAATYQAARRCTVGGTLRPWSYATVPTPAISYQWRNLPRGTVCQVTVRAHNPVGWSGWSPRHSIRTKR